MGKLNIKIHGARNLYNQEWFGTRHAYVVIELESRQYRTRTTDSNRNPKWEEEFAIYIANVDNTMIRFHEGYFLGISITRPFVCLPLS